MNWLKLLFNTFLRFIARLFLGELGRIARMVVQEIADDPSIITDEAKRKAAYEEIKAELVAAGWNAKDYRDHLINLAIELAVAWLKKIADKAEKDGAVVFTVRPPVGPGGRNT